MPVNASTPLSSGQVLHPLSADSDPSYWQKGFLVTVMCAILSFVKSASKLLLLMWHMVKTFEVCPSVDRNWHKPHLFVHFAFKMLSLGKKELSGEWRSTAHKFVGIRACNTGSVGISAVEVVVSSESRFTTMFNIWCMEIRNVSAKANLALI